MLIKHKNLEKQYIHIPHAFEYDNSTQLKNAVGFTDNDIGKVAYQKDTKTYHTLNKINPTKWAPVSGSMFQSLQNDNVLNITYDGDLITRTDYASGYYCEIVYNDSNKVETITYLESTTDSIVEKWNYIYNQETNNLIQIEKEI